MAEVDKMVYSESAGAIKGWQKEFFSFFNTRWCYGICFFYCTHIHVAVITVNCNIQSSISNKWMIFLWPKSELQVTWATLSHNHWRHCCKTMTTFYDHKQSTTLMLVSREFKWQAHIDNFKIEKSWIRNYFLSFHVWKQLQFKQSAAPMCMLYRAKNANALGGLKKMPGEQVCFGMNSVPSVNMASSCLNASITTSRKQQTHLIVCLHSLFLTVPGCPALACAGCSSRITVCGGNRH